MRRADGRREAGLQDRTDTGGRIVTSAAILFAVSIGVFGISNIIVLEILGVGTALAVLVDSLLVRSPVRAERRRPELDDPRVERGARALAAAP